MVECTSCLGEMHSIRYQIEKWYSTKNREDESKQQPQLKKVHRDGLLRITVTYIR
jgi:hypothetical protein